MIDDRENISQNISSFLLECLVWNIPDHIINNSNSWTDRLKGSIVYLYDKTKEEKDYKDWGEVSELLYLFRASRKWTSDEVNSFLAELWRYLEY